MHAVVFQVDMKPDWEGDPDVELDEFVRFFNTVPGFVRATWTSDGTRGLSFIVFDSEESARTVAANASVPPDAAVTFRSADVYQIVREATAEG